MAELTQARRNQIRSEISVARLLEKAKRFQFGIGVLSGSAVAFALTRRGLSHFIVMGSNLALWGAYFLYSKNLEERRVDNLERSLE